MESKAKLAFPDLCRSPARENVLDRHKVILALDNKRSQFLDYTAGQQRQHELIRKLMAGFASADCSTLLDRIEQTGVAWPGARPTAELDQARDLRLPFGRAWRSHEDARAWALDALANRPVLAVDGSQITPTKDFSVPVGAVQVGWYVNYHIPGGRYIKDVEFEVLGPDELAAAEEDLDQSGDGFPNWRINQVRFDLECRRLCRLMEEHAALPEERRPLCFFDGSFVISFAGQMRPNRARPYLDAVESLLACSQRHRVPLVAFVDTSYSRDLVTLIELLAHAPNALTLSDAALLAPRLPEWGDRSPFFLCARDDALSRDNRAPFYEDVAFTYVRLTQDRSPARVEMPRWQVESGLAETVMDRVRAECVVGAGYPYAVETADAAAVITQQDRQRFYALFQQFVESQGIPLTLARKAASKLGRRV